MLLGRYTGYQFAIIGALAAGDTQGLAPMAESVLNSQAVRPDPLGELRLKLDLTGDRLNTDLIISSDTEFPGGTRIDDYLVLRRKFIYYRVVLALRHAMPGPAEYEQVERVFAVKLGSGRFPAGNRVITVFFQGRTLELDLL